MRRAVESLTPARTHNQCSGVRNPSPPHSSPASARRIKRTSRACAIFNTPATAATSPSNATT
jgi:hypothetical protein